MANRILVMIDKHFTAVNPPDDFMRFVTGKPERIGDDAVGLFKTEGLPVEKTVRYLRSEGHVKDGTYLVDLKEREAWPYEACPQPMVMFRYRDHRGALIDSLETTQEMGTAQQLIDYVHRKLGPGNVVVEKYGNGIDERCGWDTHIVTHDGCAVGFTDGPVDTQPTAHGLKPEDYSGENMSNKQWGHGFHAGEEQGVEIGMEAGEKIGEGKTKANIVMKALCMATAIRDAQKRDLVSQYVLLEVLIDLLAGECGGRIDDDGGRTVDA